MCKTIKNVYEEALVEYKKKYPHGCCEVIFCKKPRWEHPEKGRLCVCEDHYREIERGERRVPPLRKNIDYCSIARPTFLVSELPREINLEATKDDENK